MSTWKKELLRISGTGGAIAGGLGVAMFLILYAGGIHLFDMAFQLDYWFISLPFIVIGIWYYRKSYGQLRFWQGLSLGMLTNLFGAVIISLFLLVFLSVVDPGFIKVSGEYTLDQMKLAKDQYVSSGVMSEEKFAENMRNMEQALSTSRAIDISVDKLVRFSAIGFIYTFIASLIFRK